MFILHSILESIKEKS
jgi:hypothetical protein